MGGLSRFRCSPVERDEAPPDAFGKRVDALRQVLAAKKLMTVDELRKNIEALPPEAYDRMGYYERWVTSITQIMVQRGVITSDELARKMAEVKARD